MRAESPGATYRQAWLAWARERERGREGERDEEDIIVSTTH